MGGYQSKQAITRLEHALFSQKEESKRKPPARGRGRHAPRCFRSAEAEAPGTRSQRNRTRTLRSRRRRKAPARKGGRGLLKDRETIRKPLARQKCDRILELFAKYAAPKSDARHITPEDIKKFLA